MSETRPFFPEPPSAEIVQAFRDHVARTGQPETFPSISTSRPPGEGRMQILHNPIFIDWRLRPSRDRAPCPICSSDTGKWLRKGTLLWCEATRAIYAVGPDCYRTLWTDGRFNEEMALYRQTEKQAAAAAALEAHIWAAASVIAWAHDQRWLARRVEVAHRELAESAPRLRGALSRDLKARAASTSQISGADLLRGRWRLVDAIEQAAAVYSGAKEEAGPDVSVFVRNLAPTAVADRLSQLEKAANGLKKVYDHLAAAAAFLTPRNCIQLAVWARSGAAPIEFTAVHTGSRLTLRTDREYWTGPVGVPVPRPLPPLMMGKASPAA